MTTLLLTHPCTLAHDTGPGHPERPDRMRAVAAALAEPTFATLDRREAPVVAREALLRVHPEAYIASLEAAAPSHGRARLDADTSMSAGTLEAAQRGAGAAVQAVDLVATRRHGNAFVAMRPPGHHAETATAMGFCFFNNAAIAARHAQAAHGAERVAIIDFDVHHGNGSQEIFWNDPTVLYASTHEMPLYPGTGAKAERGAHDQIVNAPLRAGDDGAVFRDAFMTAIAPRLDAFAPDFVIVSAGFDAHERDPLGHLRLTADDFAWVTRHLLALARARSGGRLVSLLEGGYDLDGLAQSAAAHVECLMEEA